MSQAILLVTLMLLSLLVLSTCSSRLFSNQLHCLTTIYLTDKVNAEQGSNVSTGPSSNHKVNMYQVEEFVDLNSRRSTVSIADAARDKAEIYYSQVGPHQSSKRSFVLYKPHNRECTQQRIASWTLTPVRQVAINLHESSNGVERGHLDVSIGPGGLLYAIESNLGGFVFKSRIFSRSKMAKVDVFTKEIELESFNGSEDVNIIVYLMTQGRGTPEEGETLEGVYNRVADLNIALIGACKTGKSDNLESLGAQTRKSKEGDGQRQSQQNLNGIQLDKDTFCKHDQLIFAIHYHMVSVHRPGTLVGRSLEDFSRGFGYDFRLEPFMMPVGIGCLSGKISLEAAWQKSLTRSYLSGKFSAEYVSLYGEPGVSFVAHDRERRLLRVDRAGRKSVYDLSYAKSYHIGEFSPSGSNFTEEYNSADDAQIDTLNIKGKDSAQCVVLDIASSSSPIQLEGSMDAQVIGLENSHTDRYLGSRMLDHVDYEVFEKEWLDKTQLPLILRTAKFLGMKPTENKRLFLTYYAQTVAASKQSGSSATSEQLDKIAGQSEDGEALLLSFVEVWQFDTVKKERRLINRVKFLEFSWDLDIEPADDHHSQKPGSVKMGVFQVEPCHQDRAAQAELVVSFSRVASKTVNLAEIDVSKESQHLLCLIDEYLSTVTGVAVLNLADTKARVIDSGNILATTRVVELRTGISTAQSLGLISYKLGELMGDIEKIVFNRHSQDECRLESISVSSTNWFAHCPHLAACLMLKESDELKLKMANGFMAVSLLAYHKQERNSSPGGVKWDVCSVESFRYQTVDVLDVNTESNALHQAFEFVTETKRKLRKITVEVGSGSYEAEVIAFKQLDSIGARLKNDVTLLSNLKYTTTKQEPTSFNLNTRIEAKTRMDALRFCQLACQMDDICGSFSMCSLPSLDGVFVDCVLSSIRLTGERLNKILAASIQNEQSEKFHVNISGEIHSQVLVMERNDRCSLHPRDFLADYHVDNIRTTHEKNTFGGAYKLPTDKLPGLYKRHLDLEDCAGFNFELEQFNDQFNTNFTYCPLNSHCIPGVDNFSSQIEGTTEYCYFYKRHATRAYNKQPMMHMIAIRLDSAPSGQLQSLTDEKAKQHVDSLLDRLGLLESHAKSEGEQLSRTSWASSEQDCARNCNMHKSRCLAFDSCRRNDRVLCILYSKRSPLMRDSARFPLLKQERDSMAKYKTGLDANKFCDHYYLKEDYFEVRLNTMLAEEQQGSAVRKNDRRQQAINELEMKIDLENRRQNDQIVSSLIEDVKQMADHEIKDDCRGSSGNQFIHSIFLLIGLFVGAVGILYRQQILNGAERIHRIYRGRRARVRNTASQPLPL